MHLSSSPAWPAADACLATYYNRVVTGDAYPATTCDHYAAIFDCVRATLCETDFARDAAAASWADLLGQQTHSTVHCGSYVCPDTAPPVCAPGLQNVTVVAQDTSHIPHDMRWSMRIDVCRAFNTCTAVADFHESYNHSAALQPTFLSATVFDIYALRNAAAARTLFAWDLAVITAAGRSAFLSCAATPTLAFVEARDSASAPVYAIPDVPDGWSELGAQFIHLHPASITREMDCEPRYLVVTGHFPTTELAHEPGSALGHVTLPFECVPYPFDTPLSAGITARGLGNAGCLPPANALPDPSVYPISTCPDWHERHTCIVEAQVRARCQGYTRAHVHTSLTCVH